MPYTIMNCYCMVQGTHNIMIILQHVQRILHRRMRMAELYYVTVSYYNVHHGER